MTPSTPPEASPGPQPALQSSRQGLNTSDRITAPTMRRSVGAPAGPTSGNSRLASDAPEVTDRRESESAPKAMGSTRVETDRGAATEGTRHSNVEIGRAHV